MLRTRVITALVLAPLIVVGVLFGSSDVVALVMGLVVLLGAREWARLAGLGTLLWAWLAMVLLLVLMVLVHLLAGVDQMRLLASIATALWMVATLRLVWRREPVVPVSGQRPVVLLSGLLILLIAWSSVVNLHAGGEQGPILLLFLLVLIWVSDSGAYFVGRAFGRRKLSPQVSPGKTWEGVAGAIVGSLLCAVGLHLIAAVDAPLSGLLMLCLVVTLVSIGGDLFESLLKRQAGMKDSGTLLPGHGGMLDRIDSVLAAAPVFLVGLSVVSR